MVRRSTRAEETIEAIENFRDVCSKSPRFHKKLELCTCVAEPQTKLAAIKIGKSKVVVVNKFNHFGKSPVSAVSGPFENKRKATAQVTIIRNLYQTTEQSGKEQLVLSNQSTTRRVPPIGGLPRRSACTRQTGKDNYVWTPKCHSNLLSTSFRRKVILLCDLYQLAVTWEGILPDH